MPARAHQAYWVYIINNRRNGTLYIGVTNSLERRIWQHRNKTIEGFSKKYGLSQLVYFEEFRHISNASARETELKGWLRRRKIELIEQANPEWNDLAGNW